jgi:hypothetical protein
MNRELNPPEFEAMPPVLEQAVTEIRDESADPAVIEAAAARVWIKLNNAAKITEAGQTRHVDHNITGCSAFQALIPDYRAGRLSEARALLLKDHLNECVACRKVFEGRVLTMPVQGGTQRRTSHTVRWAAAAVVVAAAGLSIWIAVDRYGTPSGRAIVKTVNGTLYEILPTGIQPLAQGQDLPDGVEIRTAKDSGAVLQLRDGSEVELRERSGFSSTQTASDLTIHLDRGSIIVQAAHRSSGHLFVATADCRVAVTGTVFSVSSGDKGSRVSVIQGEVHVSQNNASQDNRDQVLHPGDQTVTSASLEPVSVKDDIAWSRDRDRLVQQLESLRKGLAELHLPQLRYSSRLIGRLSASTVFFASIPNLGSYLGQAQSVFRKKMDENPELSSWWAGHGVDVEPMLAQLRAASDYLGDEIVITGFADQAGKMQMPVFLAEAKREGFADFLKREHLPLHSETRNGLVAFSPNSGALAAFAPALDKPSGGFPGGFTVTPFYSRIAESYRDGAGLLLSADLSQLGHRPLAGARYFIAEEKEVNNQMEARASVGFDGARTGIASWLANPSPMGSLEYVSPDATLVAGFVVKDAVAIVDETLQLQQRSESAAQKTLAEAQQRTGIDVRNDLARALGSEFSVSLDGAAIPVPSWKLVIEVYDPNRFQATLQKAVEAYNREAAKSGGVPLRTSQEVAEGRTYYMIAWGNPNPLTEVHYTMADGYLIAAPSRALIIKALQVKTSGTSITHSTRFASMVPRDRNMNFSALIYQNLGSTLAPIAGLLGSFIPAGNADQSKMLQNLGNMKPLLIAAYGEQDRISVATSGDMIGMSLTNLMSGNLLGIAGNAIPFNQFQGAGKRMHAMK